MKTLIVLVLAILSVGLFPSCEKKINEEKVAEALSGAFDEMRIKGLIEKRDMYNKSVPILAKFKLLKTSGDDRGNIEATFQNSTKYAISAALCRYVVKTPGRTIAWHEEDIYFFFHGGIEPGEKKKGGSSKGLYKMAPKEAVPSLTIIALSNGDNKTLAKLDFSDAEAEELKELLGKK